MKILILSCNTGGGHNSAAAALRGALAHHGAECDVADALAFLSPRFSRFLSGAHVLAYRRAPRAFAAGYRMEERHPCRRLFRRVFHDTAALRAFLEAGSYDAVIAVHVFGGMMMTQLRRSGAKTPPLAFVATDYTCSPGVGALDMDAWFIPHEALRQEFADCGVPEEKLIPAGIPVRRCFYDRIPQEEARRRLGLPAAGRMALLCCGSMGCGPMGELAEELALRLPEGDFLAVVCGTNGALAAELERRSLPRTRVVGYTEEMSLYMDAAQLFLTKSGGLSTAEALAKGIPLLYVDAVGGCETRNREFMLARGFADGAESSAALAALAADYLAQPTLAAAQLRRRGTAFAADGAETIASFALGQGATLK